MTYLNLNLVGFQVTIGNKIQTYINPTLVDSRGKIRVQRRGGGFVGRGQSGAAAPEGGLQVEPERGAQEPRHDHRLRLHRHAATPLVFLVARS